MTITYKQAPDCETVEVDGEWIILHTENFTVTKLNESGGLCWSLLKEKTSAGALLKSIRPFSAHYTETDIQLFLDELTSCGLIEHASQ
ncbi:PqqD family protein [Metabacillus indicus]|uniref:PqqD family protein n=1 Tax=Metabacillus indicus TaxID=246786 RepID=UPI0005525B49|nr:PqqD family protein [Metabacillus indicus]